MEYKRTEQYIFNSQTEWQALTAFESAHPDWKKDDSTVMTVFTKTDSVYCEPKEVAK